MSNFRCTLVPLYQVGIGEQIMFLYALNSTKGDRPVETKLGFWNSFQKYSNMLRKDIFPFNWLWKLIWQLLLKFQNCYPRDSAEMTCLLPPGVVPSAFVSSDNTGTAIASQKNAFLRLQNPNRRRRKKRSPLARLSDPNNSTCDIYLGFVLDNLPTYENTSKSLPNVVFAFTTTFPTIVGITDVVTEYNPDTSDHIQIKVSQ